MFPVRARGCDGVRITELPAGRTVVTVGEVLDTRPDGVGQKMEVLSIHTTAKSTGLTCMYTHIIYSYSPLLSIVIYAG